MSSTHATRLNPALIPPTDDPERIFREQELSFHSGYSHEGLGHVSDDKRYLVPTLDQTFHCYVAKALLRAQRRTAGQHQLR